ncbi:hypothetical protein [Streptomyces sp.]|uniref:hypothetical protein n=1 Tax=Streptomyces sp. TaxID=1931 RepID=UPI002F3E7924
MQQHQQGNHGWSVFHEGLSLAAADSRTHPGPDAGPDSASGSGPGELDRLLSAVWRARPRISDSHLITLLGIALRTVADTDTDAARVFRPQLPGAVRAGLLSAALARHHDAIAAMVTEQSNSYTGARRFLVPQLLLGAYAAHHRIAEVRLLDIGTSIGLLPRQLNNRTVYDRFAPGLSWHPAAPAYRDIPLAARFGIDAPPLPTLDWVRGCHGPSDYYTERFSEVVWALEQTAGTAGDIGIHALDMLDLPALADFVHSHHINVATCNFVLYQYDEPTRERIIATVTGALRRPGLLLSMEPGYELRRMGARVRGYRAGSTAPLHLADVSDAHFLGRVTPGADFAGIAGAVRSA